MFDPFHNDDGPVQFGNNDSDPFRNDDGQFDDNNDNDPFHSNDGPVPFDDNNDTDPFASDAAAAAFGLEEENLMNEEKKNENTTFSFSSTSEEAAKQTTMVDKRQGINNKNNNNNNNDNALVPVPKSAASPPSISHSRPPMGPGSRSLSNPRSSSGASNSPYSSSYSSSSAQQPKVTMPIPDSSPAPLVLSSSTGSQHSWMASEKENLDIDGNFEEDHKAKMLISQARKALNNNGGVTILKRYLSSRVHALFENGGRIPSAEEVRSLMIAGWIEELLRFLAIKAIAGDTSQPYEMAASKPIDVAWRGLMIMPATYWKVCQALGSDIGVIDHDPFWDEADISLEQKRKRLGITLRVYRQCLDQEAPRLYWPELKESRTRKKETIKLISSGTSQPSLMQSFSGLFRNGCQSPDPDSSVY